MAQRFEFTVSPEHSGQRVDQIIAAMVPQLSRTKTKKILAEGGVFIDKQRVKIESRALVAGQRVVVHYNASLIDPRQEQSDWVVPIISANPDYLVVDKPSGLFSAPTPDSDRNDVLHVISKRLREEGKSDQLFVVHRLDRPTSGLMLLALHSKAAAALSAHLESHAVFRQYLAIVLSPAQDEKTVETPIAGKTARTHFRVLERRGALALVEATLETGRTHQVRIHAASMGSPILGDSKYGRGALRAAARELGTDSWGGANVPRLALHAHRLCVPGGVDGERNYVCPLPTDLNSFWDAQPHR